jgi:cyclohexanecarboxylate-CoA ligase
MRDELLGVILPPSRIEAMVGQGHWSNELLIDYFDRVEVAQPNATAVVSYKSSTAAITRVTFAELGEAANRIALRLVDLGVSSGAVVSVQLPSWWQFLAIHLACTRIGCIINPIMPGARQQDLRVMLRLADSQVLFIPRRFRNVDFPEMIESIRHEFPELRHVVVVDGDGVDSFDGLPQVDPSPTSSQWAELATRRPGPNDVVEIIFTSGTTGEPKGVMHTSNTLVAATRGFAQRTELRGDDVIFMGSPLAHQTGFLWGMVLPILLGAKVVLLDIWSPEKAAELISQEGATFSVSAPTFLTDLLAVGENSRGGLSSLRTFVLAGAPVPKVLVERAVEQLGIRVMSAWGMTEVGLPTITRPADPIERVAASDGVTVEGTGIRIIDESGHEMGTGHEGRLQARGAFNFVGYLKRPELYATDADGWFDTGDLARVDDEGYIRITGRTKDIIIRGGEKIPVVEVENALYRHPAVADVAIVAVPDPRLGERACAFITLKPGTTLTFENVVAFLTELGITKTFFPERIEIITEMPRTASGKIQKFQLRVHALTLVPT